MVTVKMQINLLVFGTYFCNSWGYRHETKTRTKFNVLSVRTYEIGSNYFLIVQKCSKVETIYKKHVNLVNERTIW